MAAAADSGAAAAQLAELNAWLFTGATVWHGLICLLGAVVWTSASLPAWLQPHHHGHHPQHGALSAAAAADADEDGGSSAFATWLLLALVWGAMHLVLRAQRRVLTTLDVPPLYIARLGWGGKSWPALILARCVLRRRTLADAGSTAALYAAAAFSGAATIVLLGGSGGGDDEAAGGAAASPPPGGADAGSISGARGGSGAAHLLYGVALGLLYAAGYLLRAGNVLAFPAVQRHRYFRLRQRLRALCKSSLLLATWALLPTTALLAVCGASWGSAAGVLGAWRAGLLAAFGWAAGAAALEVVFTERVALADDDDPSPTAPLLAALGAPDDPIAQEWALRDLAAVAEAAPGASVPRRDALFADETGASGWVPVARYCLEELTDFVGVVRAALPSLAPPAGAAGAAPAAAGAAAVRWNALQLSAAGGRAASRPHDAALWHLQARYGRLTAVLRALSGLSAAALTSDRYGLLALCTPGLAEVLAALLGTVAALQALVKHSSAIPMRPASPLARLVQQLTVGGAAAGAGGGAVQHVDAAAAALLDAATAAAYRVAAAYGPSLATVVEQAAPLVGTKAEARALLQSFLDCQE